MWSARFNPIWTMWALALLMEMGPHKDISISRANAHMVHMGLNLALHITLYSVNSV